MNRGNDPAYPVIDPKTGGQHSGMTIRERVAVDIYCKLRNKGEDQAVLGVAYMAATEADILIAELERTNAKT